MIRAVRALSVNGKISRRSAPMFENFATMKLASAASHSSANSRPLAQDLGGQLVCLRPIVEAVIGELEFQFAETREAVDLGGRKRALVDRARLLAAWQAVRGATLAHESSGRYPSSPESTDRGCPWTCCSPWRSPTWSSCCSRSAESDGWRPPGSEGRSRRSYLSSLNFGVMRLGLVSLISL